MEGVERDLVMSCKIPIFPSLVMVLVEHANKHIDKTSIDPQFHEVEYALRSEWCLKTHVARCNRSRRLRKKRQRRRP